MTSAANAELVQLGDINELVRHVDRLCAAAAWDELVELHDLCEKALERGRQLWPVAAHAEYRLALEAPAPYAARTLVSGTGRFTLGPLPEVAASTHTWADLAPHVPAGPAAAMAAHERVLHGDSIVADARVMPGVIDLPLRLEWWEPHYPVAEYKPHEASFPSPSVPRLEPADLRSRKPRDASGCAAECDALVALAAVWTAESNGRAEVQAVRGGALDAIAAFGLRHCRAGRVRPPDALALMAWTGASGGAHGRRRGMASGRFAAWWAAAALTGLLEEWPVDPDVLGEAIAELEWWVWDAGGPDTGWSCRLAIHDPDDGLAWALSALDARL